MSVAGTISLVNVRNKPQLLNLNTAQADEKTSKLSNVTWRLTTPVETTDTNHAAVVKMKSVSFMNVFENITEGSNLLKVVSVWLNDTTLDRREKPVVIPPGQYSDTQLLAYLNADGVCNENPADNGGYYMGLGEYGGVDPFIRNTLDESLLQFKPPLAIDGDNVVGAHKYVAFYLKYDAQTAPLMKQLGLVQMDMNDQAVNAEFFPTYNNQPYELGVGFSMARYSTGATYALPAATISPPVNPMDLSGVKNILFSLEAAGCSSVRASVNKLNQSDIIGSAPVSAPYRVLNHYEPSQPFEIVVPRFSLSNFHILAFDAATGRQVNFRGVHWNMEIEINFLEIENNALSELGASGSLTVIRDLLHRHQNDHRKPYSGTKRPRDVPDVSSIYK